MHSVVGHHERGESRVRTRLSESTAPNQYCINKPYTQLMSHLRAHGNCLQAQMSHWAVRRGEGVTCFGAANEPCALFEAWASHAGSA
jgi:hypothetical protein